MRISDWSSNVCSSDLSNRHDGGVPGDRGRDQGRRRAERAREIGQDAGDHERVRADGEHRSRENPEPHEDRRIDTRCRVRLFDGCHTVSIGNSSTFIKRSEGGMPEYPVPDMTDVSMEGVLKALGDPTRLAIVPMLADGPARPKSEGGDDFATPKAPTAPQFKPPL